MAGTELRVVEADGTALGSFPAPGGIGVLTGIGGSFFAGWGRTKAFPAATASVTGYGVDGHGLATEVVATPTTSRPQVVAIESAGPTV